jgi:hypothetical protein
LLQRTPVSLFGSWPEILVLGNAESSLEEVSTTCGCGWVREQRKNPFCLKPHPLPLVVLTSSK